MKLQGSHIYNYKNEYRSFLYNVKSRVNLPIHFSSLGNKSEPSSLSLCLDNLFVGDVRAYSIIIKAKYRRVGKVLKWILGVVIVIYVLVCVVLYINQEKVLFLEEPLSSDHIYRKGKEELVNVEDGVQISCYRNRVPNPKGVILYFHGNKGNNRRCIRQSEMMEGNKYDIYMPDYRGFGKSQGELESDDQFYADAQIVYDIMKKEYGEENIVLVGYSMGSGPATYLAGTNKPRDLFLISPFKSIVDMKNRYIPFVPSFLIKYQFPNWKYLEQTTCPINIFYTPDDSVVLPESSLALAEHTDHEQLVRIDGTSHRGMIFRPEFRRLLQEQLAD